MFYIPYNDITDPETGDILVREGSMVSAADLAQIMADYAIPTISAEVCLTRSAAEREVEKFQDYLERWGFINA